MGCMVKTIDFSAAALDVLLGWSIDLAFCFGRCKQILAQRFNRKDGLNLKRKLH